MVMIEACPPLAMMATSKQLNPQAFPKPNRTPFRGAESDPNPNLARRNRSESEPGKDETDPNLNSGKAIRTRGLLYRSLNRSALIENAPCTGWHGYPTLTCPRRCRGIVTSRRSVDSSILGKGGSHRNHSTGNLSNPIRFKICGE